MRNIFILIFFTFGSIVYSQSLKQGIVRYGQKQSFGMGAPIGVDYNAYLVFNNNQSSYVSQKDSLEGGHIREFVKIKTEDNQLFVHTRITNKIGFIQHIDRKSKMLISRDIGYRYVKQAIPEIHWKITSETKKVGSFECQKATTKFRGRAYTAWFTSKIPLPYGPWKLNGLPGLILEAYDTNKEIYFYFKSIDYPSTQKIIIESPNPKNENKSWITFEEYKKQLYETFQRHIENGRLSFEQVGIDSDENKITMDGVFIEAFDK